MIKYNLAVWNGIFWLWLLYASWRRRSGGVRCIAWLLLGTSAAIAPFAAVLAVQGCLDDCVREYVINAASTVSRVENSIFGWPVKASVAVTALLVPAGIALCPMARREKLLHLSAFAVFFFSFFVSSRYAYNFALTGIFFIPLAVWTASLCRSWAARSPVLALLCLLVLLCCTGSNLYLNGRKTSLQRFPTLFWPDSHARSNFRYVSGLMQRVPHPRVCYMECYPQPEFGVAAQALPACKYWAAQNGRTTEMAQSQWNDCKAMKPDFIVALPQYDDVAQKIDTLKALGYIEHSLPYPDESGHKLDYIILEKPRE